MIIYFLFNSFKFQYRINHVKSTYEQNYLRLSFNFLKINNYSETEIIIIGTQKLDITQSTIGCIMQRNNQIGTFEIQSIKHCGKKENYKV